MSPEIGRRATSPRSASTCATQFGGGDGGGERFAGDLGRARNAAEPHTQRAVLDQTAVAVPDRGAAEVRQVRLAGGVDVRGGPDRVQALMIGEVDRADHLTVAVGADELAVEPDVYSGVVADPVEDEFHRLGVEYHGDRGESGRCGDRAEAAQPAQHLLGDAEHHLARWVGAGVDPAVGQYVAERRGAAQARAALDQQGPRPGAGGADGGRHARRAAPATTTSYRSVLVIAKPRPRCGIGRCVMCAVRPSDGR